MGQSMSSQRLRRGGVSLVSESENATEELCAMRWPLSASKSENAAKVPALAQAQGAQALPDQVCLQVPADVQAGTQYTALGRGSKVSPCACKSGTVPQWDLEQK